MANNYGAKIKSGASDWQIFQQDSSGNAVVSLKGTYSFPEAEIATAGTVTLRVLNEDDYAPVSTENVLKPALTRPDGTWEAEIKIPAGGLYRIETSLCPKANILGWGLHGDSVHHIGVGDLWVIAGQSNASGSARGEIPDGPELGVHILRNEEKWDIASHPLNDTRGNNHSNLDGVNPSHSPFLVFAKTLKKALGYPIGLVQTALGGAPLSQWNLKENPDAPLYRNMLHCIKLAGSKVAGVCWYQGCSDAMTPPAYLSYLERFGQFVESLRHDLNQNNLPFLTVQLNRYYVVPTEELQVGWSVVREAQRQAVNSISGVAIVPTIDLPLWDTIHNNPAGNLTLGQRLAGAALGLCYKKDIPYLFPEIGEATAQNGGKKVILRFNNVQHQLISNRSVIEDFTVEDKKGKVGIEKVEFSGGSEITLTLDRRLEGKAFVHNGFGIDPKTSIFDVISLKPLLAFYRFSVKT